MEVDEREVLCLVCQGVLVTPVHVVCQKACGTKMCQGCWTEFSLSCSGRPRCPVCKSLVFPDLTGKDYTLDALLSRCTRRCMNAGCDEPPGPYASMCEHEAVCPHRLLPCPHCSKLVKALDWELHGATCDRVPCRECPQRVTCSVFSVGMGCGFRGTASDVEAHRRCCRLHEFSSHLSGLYSKVATYVDDVRERHEVLSAAQSW